MKIQWLGHSCFLVTADEYRIVLDPYADGKVPGLRPLQVTANAVLCSHAHDDHGAANVITLAKDNLPSPFTIIRVDSAHDDENGAKRGKNTIHVLEANGLRIAHLGDLGHELTDGQLAAIGLLDAVMIPVGGFYTIDAKTAKSIVNRLQPVVTLPMHYRSDSFGFDVIGTLDEYLALCDDVQRYPSDTLELTKDMPQQTAVLTYQ